MMNDFIAQDARFFLTDIAVSGDPIAAATAALWITELGQFRDREFMFFGNGCPSWCGHRYAPDYALQQPRHWSLMPTIGEYFASTHSEANPIEPDWFDRMLVGHARFHNPDLAIAYNRPLIPGERAERGPVPIRLHDPRFNEPQEVHLRYGPVFVLAQLSQGRDGRNIDSIQRWYCDIPPAVSTATH